MKDEVAQLLLEGDFDNLILTTNDFIVVGNEKMLYKIWIEQRSEKLKYEIISGSIKDWNLYHNDQIDFFKFQTDIENIVKVYTPIWDVVYLLTDEGDIYKYKEATKLVSKFNMYTRNTICEYENTGGEMERLEESIHYKAFDLAVSSSHFQEIFFVGERMYKKKISFVPPEYKESKTRGLFVLNKNRYNS